MTASFTQYDSIVTWRAKLDLPCPGTEVDLAIRRARGLASLIKLTCLIRSVGGGHRMLW
jgi:hypothetical protein